MALKQSTPGCFLLACLLLAGCGDYETTPLGKGLATLYVSKHCFEGVTYLRSDRSLSVQLDRDGKVIPCK